MPQVKRKKRRAKTIEAATDEAESESGCLSSQLSRTRLGKENLSSRHKNPKPISSNPYDGDIESELELLDSMPCSPMVLDHEESEPGAYCQDTNIMDTHSLDTDHSTPHGVSVQPVNDGCFGFESLDSPIPFSPIIAPSPLRPLGVKSSYISPRKRKKVVALYDIPIEEPAKKVIKKKKQTKLQSEPDHDWMNHLNQEFEQIAKVKLNIE